MKLYFQNVPHKTNHYGSHFGLSSCLLTNHFLPRARSHHFEIKPCHSRRRVYFKWGDSDTRRSTEQLIKETLGDAAREAGCLPDGTHPEPEISESLGAGMMTAFHAKIRPTSTVDMFGDSSLCSVSEDNVPDFWATSLCSGATKTRSGTVLFTPTGATAL